MTFRMLTAAASAGSRAPVRIVDDSGGELEWANRFLDALWVRGLAPLSLRAYAVTLLHFVRWWSRQPGLDVARLAAEQFTESTLLDYVRAQLDESPKPAPETVNARSSLLRRLFRFYFHDEMPHPGAGRAWWRRSPLGYGRRRVAFAADLKLKVPRRVIVPLQPEQVARFWQSFAAARDLAMVALMLLNGLRSREVIGLRLSDVLWSEAQLRVRGKGARVRVLPLPPETLRILDCWLKTERPATHAPELFVCLKGKARGCPMTPAGLRSLFRHHRATTGVAEANPHRFRHTFGADMIRAGVSLPALQKLMGHAHIHTTLLYIQLTAQDVFAEYARAVEKMAREPMP
jgi:integrase/recombinase XerD